MSDTATPRPWDARAPWWKESFTGGADVEYEKQILPIIDDELRGSRRVLDLGCGEGHVARHVARLSGVRAVVGIDPSAGQLANAHLAGTAAAHPKASNTKPTSARRRERVLYTQGAGESLPFATASFDAIVCCLAIEHAEDVDAVLAEVARVVAPGGRFVLLVNHPMYQGAGSGFIDDQILHEQYWRVGAYLRETVNVEEVEKGVFISFAHRPLSSYINPLCAAGLVLTKLLEPAPLAEFLAQSIAPELERAIPRLLVMCFERRPT